MAAGPVEALGMIWGVVVVDIDCKIHRKVGKSLTTPYGDDRFRRSEVIVGKRVVDAK